MARIWPGRRPRDGEPEAPADELAAELAAAYWEAYAERMASVGFLAMTRKFPGLVGHALRLGWQASRRDTVATISLNLLSGVFTGYALLATTGVLDALFAAGPTPHRVRAALPSLALVVRRRGAVGPAGLGGLGAGAAAAADRPGRGDSAVRPDHARGLDRVRRRAVPRRDAARP
jgi:hypothetical protein